MKRIGIVGWKTGENSFGATSTYLEFISKFGEPVILMPNHDPKTMELDLLILPGGLDLNPVSYGQSPGFQTSNTDVFKQHFYDVYLDTYIGLGTPIFGICLGFQMICSKFGLPLVQDLIYHDQSKERWAAAHELEYTEVEIPTKYKPILKTFETQSQTKDKKGQIRVEYPVNSHHHQGVVLSSFYDSEGNLGQLLPVFQAPDDVVEMVIHKSLPIIGVQWHPEEWYDGVAVKAVSILLSLKETITKGETKETKQVVSASM